MLSSKPRWGGFVTIGLGLAVTVLAGCVQNRPVPEYDARTIAENNRGVALMGKFDFDGARQVFEDLVLDEERHYDQYDSELDSMAKFGDRYLALQSIERSKNRASGQPPA